MTPERRSTDDGPPRLLTWLISAALPSDVRGRSILGDLIEEWHRRPAGPSRLIWYARETLVISARYSLVRSRRGLWRPIRSARMTHGSSAVREMAARLWDEFRHSVRGLRQHVAFAATSIGVLALGIGSATAIFTAFHAIAIDGLPVVEEDRLVHFSLQSASGESVPLDPEEIAELTRSSRLLRSAAGVANFGALVFPLLEEDRPLVLGMSSVTTDFFDVLGVRPALGRFLRDSDGVAGAARVTVLTHEAWQRDFGGDPSVLGRQITQTQTRRTYSVVGIAPPGLSMPAGVGYWVPVGPPGGRAFGGAPMDVIARLADGSSADASRDEFLTLARGLDLQRAQPAEPVFASARPLTDVVLGDVQEALFVITGAVALLFLIACVNVGSLLVIRTTHRRRELSVRRALGASATSIGRLLAMESALIGALGGVLGLGLASGLLQGMQAIAPDRLPRAEMIGLTGAPIAVALSTTMLAVLVFGVLPPLVAARGDLGASLRIDARSGGTHVPRRRLRRGLVAVQVALAVVLLFGAGLVGRSLERLRGLDLGYDLDRVAVLEVTVDRSGRGPAETFALLADVLDRLRAAPDVSSATWIMSRPFLGRTGVLNALPRLEGQSEAEAEGNPRLPLEVGGAELFQTLGVSIVQGRGLLDTDHEDAPRVAVVSEAVAQSLWPGRDPIGQQIWLTTSRPASWTVVGVAGDTRFRDLREATPTIYVHYRQLQILPAAWTVAVRTNRELEQALPDIQSSLETFDGAVRIWRAGSLEEHLSRGPLAEPRMSAVILSGFGLAALVLATLGLYGVMTLAVRERAHELGVRRALGASATRLRSDVLRDALFITGVGTAVGMSIGLALSRLLRPLLFEIGPWDPTTGIGVCVALVAVGGVAALIPAARATRADPMQVLRVD